MAPSKEETLKQIEANSPLKNAAETMGSIPTINSSTAELFLNKLKKTPTKNNFVIYKENETIYMLFDAKQGLAKYTIDIQNNGSINIPELRGKWKSHYADFLNLQKSWQLKSGHEIQYSQLPSSPKSNYGSIKKEQTADDKKYLETLQQMASYPERGGKEGWAISKIASSDNSFILKRLDNKKGIRLAFKIGKSGEIYCDQLRIDKFDNFDSFFKVVDNKYPSSTQELPRETVSEHIRRKLQMLKKNVCTAASTTDKPKLS